MRRYRSLQRVATTTTEPVSLSEAKSHCRVDVSTDDALISGYITTAREWCEDYLDRALLPQQLVMRLDRFPDEIELPRPPAIQTGTASSVAITYLANEAGATATLSTTSYRVDRQSTPAMIRPNYSGTWPSYVSDKNAVSVTWWAGYPNVGSIPQRVKTAILMCVHELYEKRGNAVMPEAAKQLLDTVSWGSYS